MFSPVFALASLHRRYCVSLALLVLFKVLFVSFHGQPIDSFTGHITSELLNPISDWGGGLGYIAFLGCNPSFSPTQIRVHFKTASDNKKFRSDKMVHSV